MVKDPMLGLRGSYMADPVAGVRFLSTLGVAKSKMFFVAVGQ